MKAFRNEKDKEVVYVQMKDLGFINTTNTIIPGPIYIEIIPMLIEIIGDENCSDYACFDDSDVVMFFKGLDFIADYDEYANLSFDEIEIKLNNIVEEAEVIVLKYNSMSGKEQAKNKKLLEAYGKLEYKHQSVSELYFAKKNDVVLQIPNKSSQKMVSKVKRKR